MSSVNSSAVLRFLDETMVRPEKYRQSILTSLDTLFGYNKSSIWRVDDSVNVFDPLAKNLKDIAVDDYINIYHVTDFFRKALEKIVSSPVVRKIEDYMSYGLFEKSDFYNCCAKPYDLYYFLGCAFFNGHKVIGSLGIWRSKNEKEFSVNDVKLMEVLTKHISNTLASNSLLNEIEYQRKVLEAYTNHSSTGLIIFDDMLKPRHFNSAALEMSSELVNKDKWTSPIVHFVQQFLRDNSPGWQTGIVKTLLSPSLKRFTVHVVPNYDRWHKEKPLYSMYIIANDWTPKQTQPLQYSNEYSLTPKELEIIDLVTQGLSNQEMADRLVLSLSTVKSHLQNIFRKCGVSNRTSLCSKFALS